MRLHNIWMMLALFLACQTVRVADACDCCEKCGCDCECQKVCRLVKTEKEIEVICWGCKCEDFCIPGPSTPGCTHCEEACDTCGCDDCNGPCSEAKKFVWKDWCPGCAAIHTKTKLLKKIVKKKVPSYKWVVEDLCSQCEAKCEVVSVPEGAEVPPVPVRNAKIKASYPTPAGVQPGT